MTLRSALFALLLLGFVSSTARAQIYSWRDPKGTLVLSDRPPVASASTFAVSGSTAIRTTRPAGRELDTAYNELIERHAASFTVRPDLVRAVIQVESGYNPGAISPKGAMGLMQLMPATAAELGVERPFDPDENIRGGVLYLRWLLNRYADNEELALAAYNAGPSAVQRYGNRIPPYQETRQYVRKIKSATTLQIAAATTSATTTLIYKIFETVGNRTVARYSNLKPSSGLYEVVKAP